VFRRTTTDSADERSKIQVLNFAVIHLSDRAFLWRVGLLHFEADASNNCPLRDSFWHRFLKCQIEIANCEISWGMGNVVFPKSLPTPPHPSCWTQLVVLAAPGPHRVSLPRGTQPRWLARTSSLPWYPRSKITLSEPVMKIYSRVSFFSSFSVF